MNIYGQFSYRHGLRLSSWRWQLLDGKENMNRVGWWIGMHAFPIYNCTYIRLIRILSTEIKKGFGSRFDACVSADGNHAVIKKVNATHGKFRSCLKTEVIALAIVR